MEKRGVINCDLTFKQCSMHWVEMDVTEKENTRFCRGCDTLVEKVDNTKDLRRVIKQRKCVAYFEVEESPLIGYVVNS